MFLNPRHIFYFFFIIHHRYFPYIRRDAIAASKPFFKKFPVTLVLVINPLPVSMALLASLYIVFMVLLAARDTTLSNCLFSKSVAGLLNPARSYAPLIFPSIILTVLS